MTTAEVSYENVTS